VGSDRTAGALALAGVLAQMVYPALDRGPLRVATVAAVLLLAAAAVAHAGAVWGARAAAALLAAGAGLALAAEVVGVHTGVPFGSYRYAGTLGPSVGGVPLVVPLAWVMLGYPCLLLGRRLGRRLGRGSADTGRARMITALTGGWTLAGWDLYLDPQMVAAGHWSWLYPRPALPGVPGVPLTNYLGWLLVSLLLIAVLDRVLPRCPAGLPVSVPVLVLTWTWLGSGLGNLVLFDRPAVAGWGLLGMGLTVLPFLLATARDRSHGDRVGAASAGVPVR
jgi:uncharacterized membrane protein